MGTLLNQWEPMGTLLNWLKLLNVFWFYIINKISTNLTTSPLVQQRPHWFFYIICFFIPSTTNPQIINSIPKIRLNLNKIKPMVKSIGIVKEKLYVRRTTSETKQIVKQNFKPCIIINLVNLSKLLKLLKIFLNIIITYINNSIQRYKHQW